MKKLTTILFLLTSLSGSGQVTQAKYTADSLIWAKRFQALENFRVTVIGGTVSPKGDSLTIALPKPQDTTYTKYRIDSTVAALKFIQTAMLVYNKNAIDRDAATNKRIDNLPASTPFDPSTINATLDELATAIHDLQVGKATQVQVDLISDRLDRLRNYLKAIE